MELSQRVFDAVIKAYSTLPPKCRPTESQWTVLAGIVAERRLLEGAEAEAPPSELLVLTLGSGTKCLGQSDMKPDGSVVNDCHAEVLARRAFKLYLLQEVRQHKETCRPHGVSWCHVPGILQHNADCSVFSLQPEVSLHLYISDSPCGDAAIYDDWKPATSTMDSGSAAHAGGIVSGTRRTGAKPLPASADREAGDANATIVERKARARTKSGRSDLPPSRRTLSMSCSDKVASWLALGLQVWLKVW
jgi:tRNA-specific adenosine deaminase 1